MIFRKILVAGISGTSLLGAKYRTKVQHLIAPFTDNTRQQQLADITPDAPVAGQAQQAARTNLQVASASLALVAGGSLFYAPLYLPGIAGVLYTYAYFLKGAYHAVLKKRVNIDVFMITAGIGALAGGYYFVLALGNWYGAVMRLLLTRTESHSRNSLVNLFGETPRSAWLLIDGQEVEVPFEQLQQGDQVAAIAGQTIPVDGTISAGIGTIDQHKLTGEAQPFEAKVGDPVFASTIILSGKIIIQVEKTGTETVTAQIGQMLDNTADFNLTMQSRVDTFIEKTLPGLFVLSVASLPWLGFNSALAIFWCCPGLRMSILGPMSMLNYLHLFSQRRILIKDGRSLEQLNKIDTVVFDKTGTLTQEIPQVSRIISCPGFSEDEVLMYAAAAENRQSHPIAKAILQAAEMRQLTIPQIDHTQYDIGYGIKINLNHKTILIGSDRFMAMSNIEIPPAIREIRHQCHAAGDSLVYVAMNEQLGGVIELQPTIRAEVREVIQALKDNGKTLYIISGDHEAPTRRLAESSGIDHYFANTLPENKADLVKQLQDEGRSVCFVGDGINDTIALKQANVSISLGGATTIAMDTAQIVLMDSQLTQLPDIFSLGKEFNQHLDRCFATTLVPDILAIASTYLFHWSLLTMVLYKLCLWPPQLAYVMLPLHKHKKNKPQQFPETHLSTS
ncbi:MAG: heavy metal translocating P-type ATPase [Pseudomonadota bacterium]